MFKFTTNVFYLFRYVIFIAKTIIDNQNSHFWPKTYVLSVEDESVEAQYLFQSVFNNKLSVWDLKIEVSRE